MARNGLVLIKPTSATAVGAGSSATISTNGSVSFSSCDSLYLDGVFSSLYQDYMLVSWLAISSGATAITLNLRSNGVTSTSSTLYNQQNFYAVSQTYGAARTTTLGKWEVAESSSVYRNGFIANIYSPFLARPTVYGSVSMKNLSDTTLFSHAGTHEEATSFDGFMLSSGKLITGRIAVYGLRY